MPKKEHADREKSTKERTPQPASESLNEQYHQHPGADTLTHPARFAPASLTPRGVLQLQRAVGNRAVGRYLTQAAQRQPSHEKENGTGLPDGLKAGVENLSGLSMDDVRVHYDASEPARYQALAYTQGTEIHVAPGQEGHLAHEAWHVVQQKQGRVEATGQVRGVGVNDSPALEREADEKGALAMSGGGPSAPQSGRHLHAPSLPAGGQAVQLFADKYNKDRLAVARDEDGENRNVQLDHSVSQDTMKALAATIGQIKLLVTPAKTLFTETKKSYKRFTDQVAEMPGAATHANDLKGLLLNLRVNLVPGYANTTGNPGATFDPQIEMTGNVSEQTEASGHLLTLDNQARTLNRLGGFLPAQHQGVKIEFYNKKLDEEVAATLDAITAALAAIKNMDEPEFSEDIWYTSGGKKVKRVSAEWLDAKPENWQASIEEDYPDMEATEFEWEFTVSSLEITTKNTELDDEEITGEDEYTDDATVSVTVNIPVSCWEHIYDRHTFEYFAGDIQAINTFWKEDPQTAITQELLEPEINLLIDRKFNLRRLGESETEAVNEPADKLFFQGSMDAVTALGDITITVDLKSIAPQDSDLGYAIEPDILRA